MVAAQLQSRLAPGANVLLGLSGGMDSMVLLDVLVQLAPELRFSLRALHVNHGISPNARQWSEFCAQACARLGVPFASEQVDIAPFRKLGIEGAARQARHEALARHASDCIVLAQHRDDQVETVLLQLARGTGVKGLAGMPAQRAVRGSEAMILRPLLDVPRRAIEAHARERGLQWVEDESNSDIALRRNFIRRQVLPVLETAFPAVRTAMARTAANLADTSALLDDLADQDLASVDTSGGVNVAALRELGERRARNVLRRWCELTGTPWPGAPRLGEVLRQVFDARADAAMAVDVQGWAFRRYRGTLFLDRTFVHGAAQFVELWSGESSLPLLSLGGVLRFKPEESRGLSAVRLRSESVSLRLRRGGEQLKPDCRRPRRTLKNLFQERGMPPWRRDRLPLVYCGDTLVSVPGIGDDCDWQAAPGEAGLIVSWEPFP